MSVEGEVPEKTKIGIRAVLLSKIGGVAVEDFHKDFKKLLGTHFNFREMGFSTILECMRSIPDVVRVEVSAGTGKTRFYGIGKENVYMTPTHIKAQYPSEDDGKKKFRRKSKRNIPRTYNTKSIKIPPADKSSVLMAAAAKSSIAMAAAAKSSAVMAAVAMATRMPSVIPNLVPNRQGFYTLCIRDMNGARLKKLKSELPGIQHADELRIHNSFTFVRFRDIRKAEEVLLSLNQKTLSNGQVLSVEPAREKFIGSMTNGYRQTLNSAVSCKLSKQPCQDDVIHVSQPAEILPNSTSRNTDDQISPDSNGHQYHEIFVGSLPCDTTDEELFNLFKSHGAVSARVKCSITSGKPKWFGFAEMKSRPEMKRAIKELNQKFFNGRHISVSQAKTTLIYRQQIDSVTNNSSKIFIADSVTNNRSKIQSPISCSQSTLVHKTIPISNQIALKYRKMFSDCCSIYPEDFLKDLPESFHVIVTEIHDAEYFWGQIVRFDDTSNIVELQSLTDTMQATSQRGQVSLNQTKCMASRKGEWCRCWIEQLLPFDTVKIFFVDYGDDDVKVRNEVMPLADMYWELPPQAVPFKLKGFVTETDLGDHMDTSELIENSLITVRLDPERKSQIIEVEMVLQDFEDIPDSICNGQEDDIPDIIGTGQEGNIPDLMGNGYEDDIPDLMSNGQEDDIPGIIGTGQEGNIPDLMGNGYEDDIPDIGTEQGGDIPDLMGNRYEDDIPDLMSNGQEAGSSEDEFSDMPLLAGPSINEDLYER
ncbi:uncharacterized protein [Ptychodera flava]|uniref:uncharacterized protein n=1 Tax=Ptychodera flava TaxID=63121 RepID=UPI00396A9B1B